MKAKERRMGKERGFITHNKSQLDMLWQNLIVVILTLYLCVFRMLVPCRFAKGWKVQCLRFDMPHLNKMFMFTCVYVTLRRVIIQLVGDKEKNIVDVHFFFQKWWHSSNLLHHFLLSALSSDKNHWAGLAEFYGVLTQLSSLTPITFKNDFFFFFFYSYKIS